MNTQTFFCPTEVISGAGVLEKLPEICKNYGNKCLLVMDPFFKGSNTEKRIVELLSDKEVVFYSNVTPNPRTYEINNGAKQDNITFIIGLGGGSAIDTAKAINVVYTNGGNCWDYTKGLAKIPKDITNPLLPLIAIPTTSGTGSEVTRYSVITNSDNHEKATIKTDFIFPKKALVDPELMYTVPRITTALTGIDAFAHCFESYIGSKANDFSEMFSIKGIELFADNIEKVCENGNNELARNNMALCSTLGGLAITHSATTLPHCIGQALSGITDAPHGGSIATCMSEVIRHTLPNATKKIARIACIFKPEMNFMPMDKQANALPNILDNLFTKIIGSKITMGYYGLTESRVDDVVEMAIKNYSSDLQRHPKIVSKEELHSIILKCL